MTPPTITTSLQLNPSSIWCTHSSTKPHLNYPPTKKCVALARKVAKAFRMDSAEDKFKELKTEMNSLQTRRAERAKSTGSWINVTPTIINGLSLSKGEFRDGMSLRYGFNMKNLPSKCDGCGAKFSVGHALSCKKWGLVIGRHNEVKDEIAYLATLATTLEKFLMNH